MKLSTANRISISVTLMTICIVVVFGVFVSYFTDRSRKGADEKMMNSPIPRSAIERNKQYQRIKKPQDPDFFTTEEFTSQFPGLMAMQGEKMPVRYEGNRYMFAEKRGYVAVKDVTHQMTKYRDLQKILVLGGLIAALLSFLISKLVVHRALRDLHKLADAVKEIDIEHLHLKYDWSHLPDNDELTVIAESVDAMTKQIALQIDDIKQFVGNASHELRTPLMILRSSNDLAAKTKKYDELVEKNAITISGMQQMIESLLQLAQVGTVSKKQDEVVGTVVHEIAQKYAELYGDKDIEMTITEDDDYVVSAIQGSFEHILSNLLDNAYKYTPKQGTISIIIENGTISIADTGSGLTQEQKILLWKPFWQADDSKSLDGGYGLGLTLVKRLVEANGWAIDVKDNSPNGSVFTIHYT